jgi:hypothetical protein
LKSLVSFQFSSIDIRDRLRDRTRPVVYACGRTISHWATLVVLLVEHWRKSLQPRFKTSVDALDQHEYPFVPHYTGQRPESSRPIMHESGMALEAFL